MTTLPLIIDLTNDAVALESVSLRDLENELYEMVEATKKKKSNEGNTTFAA